MAVTSGFYNSINNDRRYYASQISTLFRGIIEDGVFMTLGDALAVKESEGMNVTVGLGKAWFNDTWTENDAILPLTVEASELVLNRIDAVVLEVNGTDAVRKNTIKIIKGEPGTEPLRPTLEDSEYIHQHPLAYIYVGAEVTEITQAEITNCVGTSECPFITSVLETINADILLAQWDSQFNQWMEQMKIMGERQLDIYTGVLSAGEVELTIEAEAITTDSVLSFFTSIYGVNPSSVSIVDGAVTLTFEEQSNDITVGVSVDA